jgi:hypothetical protein
MKVGNSSNGSRKSSLTVEEGQGKIQAMRAKIKLAEGRDRGCGRNSGNCTNWRAAEGWAKSKNFEKAIPESRGQNRANLRIIEAIVDLIYVYTRANQRSKLKPFSKSESGRVNGRRQKRPGMMDGFDHILRLDSENNNVMTS